MSKKAKGNSPSETSSPAFSQGTRGKHHRAYREGHTVKIHKKDGGTVVQHFKLDEGAIVLEPDVQKYFPDSDSVNETLRALIELIPHKSRGSAGK